MGRYLVKRIVFSFIAVFGLLVLTFFLLHILPGGPFDDEISLSPQVRASLVKRYGLDLPIHEQIKNYILHLKNLDLGKSIMYSGRDVSEVVMQALPRTFSLGAGALFCSLIFGISIGFLFHLLKGKKKFHWLIELIHWFFLSAPALFLAPALVLIFGLYLDWLPVSVNQTWISYVLPFFTLAVRPTANLARLLMTSLQESLSEPWVITAKAFGISKVKILTKYAFKESLIPVFTYLGSALAGILSGSIVIENVFNIQGLGSLFLRSIQNRDYQLIEALTLLYGAILIFGVLFFDILMLRFDPRIRLK